MNKKLIIISGASLGVLIISVAAYLLFFNSKPEAVLNTEKERMATIDKEMPESKEKIESVDRTKEIKVEEDEAEVKPKEEDEEDETEADMLGAMAISFAERFGTYSSHSDYKNIKMLQPYMSKKMFSWSEKFILDNIIEEKDYSTYYGIRTKAVSQKILVFEEGEETTVLVKTVRRESTGTEEDSRKFYQSIEINIIKENGEWKVNGAHWQS